MATIDSLDNLINQSTSNGAYPIWWHGLSPGSGTAATTSSGGATITRYAQTISLPTFGSGVTGAHLTYCRMAALTSNVSMMIGIEYNLGTLTVSGNSYVDGVAMPTKTVAGSSITTAASYVMAVVTTTLSATTPVLTFNYTNQAGTTGRSGTITLPTNAAVGSAFLLTPHLQSGDTGIRNLSASGPNGLSISAGTSGVVSVRGVLPLCIGGMPTTYTPTHPDPLAVCNVPYKIESGETLAVYRFGATTQTMCMAALNFIPAE